MQVSAGVKTLIYYSPVAWSSFLTYWPLVLSGVWFWFQSKQKHSGPCLVGLLGYLSSIFLKIKHQLHLSHTIARVAFAFTIKRKYWYIFETKHKMTTLWEVSPHASGNNKTALKGQSGSNICWILNFRYSDSWIQSSDTQLQIFRLLTLKLRIFNYSYSDSWYSNFRNLIFRYSNSRVQSLDIQTK